MDQTAVEGIEAYLQGEFSGQVAIGNNIVQIGSVHGGVVYVVPDAEQVRPQPRHRPVSALPAKRLAFFGRDEVLSEALATLRERQPIEYHGVEGIGKTTLISRLAHTSDAVDCADGIVYRNVRGHSLDDALQQFYSDFYEYSKPFMPTDGQMRSDLQELRAFLLLDDAEYDRVDVERLLNYLPQSVVVLGSSKRSLWGLGRSIQLPGLTTVAGAQLMERELGRTLRTDERAAAESLVTALGGHPLRIQQVVAHLVERGSLITEAADDTSSLVNANAFVSQTLERLTPIQRQVLGLLATLRGVSLSAARIQSLAHLSDTDSVLASLQQLGLVHCEADRYCAAEPIAEILESRVSPEWMVRLCVYYLTMAERSRGDPEALVGEIEALLHIFDWAAKTRLWGDVVALARTLDATLALHKRWDAWEHVLGWALRAARELGDEDAEAWAHHQLGTRALLLKDDEQAKKSLSAALRLRQLRGDTIGAAVTRRNLGLILGAVVAGAAAGGATVQLARSDRWHYWLRQPPVMAGLAASATGAFVLGLLAVAMLLRPPPLAVTTVAFQANEQSVTSIAGGAELQGRVTLNQPAPEGGSWVSLSSDDSDIATTVESVQLQQGQTTVVFPIHTDQVAQSKTVEIQATCEQSTATAKLRVVVGVASIFLRSQGSNGPTPVIGEATLTARVQMSGNIIAATPLPPTSSRAASANPAALLVGAAVAQTKPGAIIQLTSDNSFASVPKTVTVMVGKDSAPFDIKTRPVAHREVATITAEYLGHRQSVQVAILPDFDFQVDQTEVVGDREMIGGTITLTLPAQQPNAKVTLRNKNSDAADVEQEIFFNLNERKQSFQIPTNPVSRTETVHLIAEYEGHRQIKTVVVTRPASLSRLDVSRVDPDDLTARGVVVLDNEAGANGVNVNVTVSGPGKSLIGLEDSGVVHIAKGQQTMPFVIRVTKRPARRQDVSFEAWLGGQKETATMTIPAELRMVASVLPHIVDPGGKAMVRVKLSDKAPPGGVRIGIQSSDSSVALVPNQELTVPEGQTEQDFHLVTEPSAQSQEVTLGITGVGQPIPLKLELRREIVLADLSLSQGVSAPNQRLTAEIFLSGNAEKMYEVELTVSPPGVVSVPKTVRIREGEESVTFTVRTLDIREEKASAQISATIGGEPKSTPIVVLAPTRLKELAVDAGPFEVGEEIPVGVVLTRRALREIKVPIEVSNGAYCQDDNVTILMGNSVGRIVIDTTKLNPAYPVQVKAWLGDDTLSARTLLSRRFVPPPPRPKPEVVPIRTTYGVSLTVLTTRRSAGRTLRRPVANAVVTISGQGREETHLTSDQGKLQIRLLEGRYEITVSARGYQPQPYSLQLTSDTSRTFTLVPARQRVP